MEDVKQHEPTELEAAIAALPAGSIKFETKFIPYSKVSDERKKSWSGADKKPVLFLSWEVSINGEKFDYSAGIGHISDPLIRKSVNKLSRTIYEHEDIKLWVEGKRRVGHFDRPAIQAPPNLADVLSSLLLDAGALEESFENWASNYGYDADSRKAEKIYNQCRDYAYRLVRALGADVFAQLRGKEH